jgi:hypothetical protein
MSEQDPNAKYNDWIESNEDKILSKWHEKDECWEFAVEKCVEDGVYADDVDGVMKWIEHNVTLKHVPDEFIQSCYEQSFEVDEDQLYEDWRAMQDD